MGPFLSPPIYYFFKYFTENDIEEMEGYTNIYAQQIGVKDFNETDSSEIKIFIGIHLPESILLLKICFVIDFFNFEELFML